MSTFYEFVGVVRDGAWIGLWALLVVAVGFAIFDRPRKRARAQQASQSSERQVA